MSMLCAGLSVRIKHDFNEEGDTGHDMLCMQTQTVSDRDAHDQEVEGLERKLTEAEREAAAANISLDKMFVGPSVSEMLCSLTRILNRATRGFWSIESIATENCMSCFIGSEMTLSYLMCKCSMLQLM